MRTFGDVLTYMKNLEYLVYGRCSENIDPESTDSFLLSEETAYYTGNSISFVGVEVGALGGLMILCLDCMSIPTPKNS